VVLKNPRVARGFGAGQGAFPVSAADECGLREENASRSLAGANRFPTASGLKDRDPFAYRLRLVCVRELGTAARSGRSITPRTGSAAHAVLLVPLGWRVDQQGKSDATRQVKAVEPYPGCFDSAPR
jgi:hypothetical protein